MGPISLPVLDHQANQITAKVKASKPHTYVIGKTFITINNQSVDRRLAWYPQTDAHATTTTEGSKVTIKNQDFNKRIQTFADNIKPVLGIPDYNIRVKLSKLLLHETGGSFVSLPKLFASIDNNPHLISTRYQIPRQNTASSNTTFGAIIVTLVNDSKGGELTVKHQGAAKALQSKSEFLTHCVAFYSECEVKMAPISEGYRLSLMYDLNVVDLGSRSLPRAPSAVPTELSVLLRLWKGSPTGKVGYC